MKLYFDKNFKFKGFSESLGNYVVGTIGMWTSLLGFFLPFAIFPLLTYFLIKRFRKANKKERKNQWNPLHNPIPFILTNVIWVFFACWIISGEAFKPYHPKSDYEPWDFNDPSHYNDIGDNHRQDKVKSIDYYNENQSENDKIMNTRF